MLARASETIGVELHRSGESGNELESIGWVRETHQSRKNLTILVPLPCAILRVGRLPVDHFATQNEGVPGGFDADAHDATGHTFDRDQNVISNPQSFANAAREYEHNDICLSNLRQRVRQTSSMTWGWENRHRRNGRLK